ncbi:hypothetical protein D3C71_1183050 [compost metagenome]
MAGHPCRRAAGIHRPAERNQPGHHEHRLPVDRGIGLVHAQHAGQQHAGHTGHQGQRHRQLAGQRNQDGQREDRHGDLELVRALFAGRVVGHHHEVAALGGLRQVGPDAVEDQHVAGAQLHIAHILADHLLVAVDRQQADAAFLAQAQVGRALADHVRGRRHHRFGNAGAAGVEQVTQMFQARGHAQELVLREIVDLLARAHRPQHAAHPDAHFRWRRQACVIAGLQRQQQR